MAIHPDPSDSEQELLFQLARGQADGSVFLPVFSSGADTPVAHTDSIHRSYLNLCRQSVGS